jgi:hypothetical protein
MMGRRLWQQLPKAITLASMVKVAVSIWELGRPENRATGNSDDIAGAAANTDRVIVVFITIKTCEVCIKIGINVNGTGRLDDNSFIFSSNELVTNPFKCNLMQVLGIEHETGNLAGVVG